MTDALTGQSPLANRQACTTSTSPNDPIVIRPMTDGLMTAGVYEIDQPLLLPVSDPSTVLHVLVIDTAGELRGQWLITIK